MMRGVFEHRLKAAAVLVIGGLALPGVAAGQDTAELRALIEAQRQQLEAQARQLELMEERLRQLEVSEGETQATAADAAGAAAAATAAVEAAPAPERVLTSGGMGVKLAISGQLNRMVMIANDGDNTKAYHVDNANSSSRIRFVGTANPTGAFTVGTLLEAELRTNPSSVVSQINEDTGRAEFQDRHVDVFFEHEDYGRISIGRGDTASNNTSNLDLSGTNVVAGSAIADLAGGLLFHDDDTGALSGTSVGDAFSNFDGLSRRDRLRYDTPRFAGFTLAADLISDQRWSTALRWAGKTSDFNMMAAIAYSDGNDDRDYHVDGSTAILHEPTGLSLMLAAATRDNPGRDDSLSVYTKLGWQRDFWSFGRTAFSIDYARNEDVSVEGDEAQSVGLFAVQNIRDFGVELYGGYRLLTLDRDAADFDDIHVFAFGTRVRF